MDYRTTTRRRAWPAFLAPLALGVLFACDAQEPIPQGEAAVPDVPAATVPEDSALLALDSVALVPDSAATAGQAAPPPQDTTPIEPGPPVGPEDFEIGVAPVDASLRVPRPEHVRALYINGYTAGSTRRMNALIDIADRTEINSFVIDIKEADGQVTYRSTVPMVRRVGANTIVPIGDVRPLLARLREHGIYPIARIVVFKDPVLAQARPDWAIQTAEGRIWRDHHGEIWVDSYNRNVWEYNLALAREAIALGFSEVQWDYVRFPDVPGAWMRSAVYPAREGRTRAAAIREFLDYTHRRIDDEFGVPVTADVFGVTTSASGDVGIGQDWESMSPVIDVLLPMVYPSHYPRGSFGIRHPNAAPYHTVLTALRHGVRRSRAIDGPASIRPWLQDFTLGQPAYRAAHVRAQIQAVYDAGLTEWVLWNASSRYTPAALADENGNVPHIEGLDELLAPLPDARVPDPYEATTDTPTVELETDTLPAIDVKEMEEPALEAPAPEADSADEPLGEPKIPSADQASLLSTSLL